MKQNALTRDELIVKISSSQKNVYSYGELSQLSLSELEKLHEELVSMEMASKTSGKPQTTKDIFFAGQDRQTKHRFKPFIKDDEFTCGL